MSEMQTAIAASQRVFALLDEETIQELTTSKIIEINKDILSLII